MSNETIHKGQRFLLTFAALIVCLAGLKAAGPILLPVMMAVLLSLICIPPKRKFEAMGVPSVVAVILVIICASIGVFLFALLIQRSVVEFNQKFPAYTERVDALLVAASDWARSVGVEWDAADAREKLDGGAIVKMATGAAQGLMSTLSNLLFILLTMVFILTEAHAFPKKVELALGPESSSRENMVKASDGIQDYMTMKTLLSFATGLLVGVLCYALGVDFPLLWAVLAFLLNFIPNIGSIIAAIPACLVALVEMGLPTALVLAGGYFIINMVIGNLIEPRLMGDKLGLSALVVFLSMVFWGWLWGPIGMFLSVPLTVLAKLVLDQTDDLKWLGVMLGPSPKVDQSD